MDTRPGDLPALSLHAARSLALVALTIVGASRDIARAATLSLPEDAGAPPGGSTSVTLSIDDAAGMLGTDIVLEYDPAVAVPTVVSTTALSQPQMVEYNLVAPGTLAIALYGPLPLSGGGPLLQIGFDSVGPSGSRTPLALTHAESNEGAVPLFLQDGAFCVAGTAPEVTDLMLTAVETPWVARLEWSNHPWATAYRVYRGLQPRTGLFSCFASGVPDTVLEDDGAVPPAGAMIHYLVTAVTCAGESSLGLDSQGVERPPTAPCP